MYRDRAEYAARLVDGDLGTAWNGKTGELEGAAFEIRLPPLLTALGATSQHCPAAP